MNHKTSFRIAVLVSIFVIAMPALLLAGEFGSVLTKNGTEYNDVYMVVHNQYKILELTKDTVKTNVSFSDVQQVLDAEGNDITADILQGYHKSQKATWESNTSEKRRTYNDKLFSFGIGGLGIFTNPFGDYYQGVNGGVGFAGFAVIPINRQGAIRFMVEKSGMGMDEPFGMSGLKFVLGFQYNSYQSELVPGKAIFYGVSGLGIISQKMSIKGTFYDPYSPGDVYYVDESITESDFLFNFEGGAIIPISPTVGIDLSASLDMIYGTMSGFEGVSYGFLFNIRAGLMFFLQ